MPTTFIFIVGFISAMMNLRITHHEHPKSVVHLIVYRKALKLFKTSRALATYLTNNKSVLHMHASTSSIDKYSSDLIIDAMNLAPNIASATITHDPKKRNHYLFSIKKASQNIRAYCDYLERHYKHARDYISLLKKDISDFNEEHRNWVKELDP